MCPFTGVLYLSDWIERIQKRAFRIMYPTLSDEDVLQVSCCTRLSVRRHNLCLKTFKSINNNASSKLAHLLPKERRECHGRCLRKSNNISLFTCRTNRFKRRFPSFQFLGFCSCIFNRTYSCILAVFQPFCILKNNANRPSSPVVNLYNCKLL